MRKLFFFLLRFSGLPALFRLLFQRRRVTVLLYHDTDPQQFERHLDYLSKRYHFISYEDFKAFMISGKKLPLFPMLLTFDDGHQGNYALLEIFRRTKIRPLIFLTSCIINTDERFWWMGLSDIGKLRELKEMPNHQRIAELSSMKDAAVLFPRALNMREIAEMKPWVDFECHTATHPILPRCTLAEIELELLDGKNILESDYGLSISALAYPNGDFDQRVLKCMKDFGYRFGFSLVPGYNSRRTPHFIIRRFSATDNSPVSELAAKASGVFWFLKKAYYAFRIR